jgi:hypothetical protein
MRIRIDHEYDGIHDQYINSAREPKHRVEWINYAPNMAIVRRCDYMHNFDGMYNLANAIRDMCSIVVERHGYITSKQIRACATVPMIITRYYSSIPDASGVIQKHIHTLKDYAEYQQVAQECGQIIKRVARIDQLSARDQFILGVILSDYAMIKDSGYALDIRRMFDQHVLKILLKMGVIRIDAFMIGFFDAYGSVMTIINKVGPMARSQLFDIMSTEWLNKIVHYKDSSLYHYYNFPVYDFVSEVKSLIHKRDLASRHVKTDVVVQ